MRAGGVAAFVGLGSNLDQPERQVRQALLELDGLAGSRLIGHSPLYGSSPVGPPGQPNYVNAVARLETSLDAHALLDALQAIEFSHGRVRGGERWGPRPLDLDLLLFAERVIRTPRLSVPHPGLGQREFVLYPLLEIAGPDLEIPGHGPLGPLAAACARGGLQRLAPSVREPD